MSDNFRNFTIGRRHRRNMIIGVTITGLIVIIYLLYYIFAHKSSETLQLVHLVFRHGDRTPTETYVNDPYKNYNWSGGWGALTNKGKQQLFNIGQKLRNRYKSFIDTDFTVNDINVRTSNSDRCYMSAGALLAGMFPPLKEEIWHPDLMWQPIPIRAIPRNLDNLIAMKKKCNTYDKDLKNSYNSDEIKKINDKNAELYVYLTENSGQDILNITALEFLFNTIEIEDQNGLKLPKWLASVYPDKMKYLAARSLSIFTETVRMRRLKGGVFLKEAIEHITNKRSGKLQKKMFLYSGHDITLTNIIRTLGFVEDMKPEYGASFILETHSHLDSNDLEMKLFYYNSTTIDTPYALKIKSCGEPCLFNNFVKILQNVVPNDWEKECDNMK